MLTARQIDQVPRSAGISQQVDVFAIYVPSDDMDPRYERGDRLLINPSLPILPGKDVLLLSEPDDKGQQRAIVRRLVNITPASWRVKCYGPKPATSNEARSAWPICYRVEGGRGR